VHALVLSKLVSQSFVIFIAKGSQEDLATLRDLMASNKLTPVVDRVYPMSEAGEAMAYLEDGHARGKVIVVPTASWAKLE
jgi:NADPH:quinone reductase-like Zn-dependent oxidoreductase